MSDSVLRKALRKKRQSLSKRQQYQHAKRLLYQCQKQAIFRFAHRVALYLAFDGEIQTHYLIRFLKQQGKQVYLPVIEGERLYFLNDDNIYKNNCFHIKEPKHKNRMSAKKLNLILMPLVGFDNKGNRLGMGAGFYDKTLSFKKIDNTVKQANKRFSYPTLIGLAHQCQYSDQIKAKPWDVPLRQVITE